MMVEGGVGLLVVPSRHRYPRLFALHARCTGCVQPAVKGIRSNTCVRLSLTIHSAALGFPGLGSPLSLDLGMLDGGSGLGHPLVRPPLPLSPYVSAWFPHDYGPCVTCDMRRVSTGIRIPNTRKRERISDERICEREPTDANCIVRSGVFAALRGLVNAHLTVMAPGWALTEPFLAAHLQRDPGQAITDPWVTERATLCALEGQRLVAAAHLLRYGRDPAVGPAMAGTGEIAWFLAWPDKGEAAAALLDAAQAQMHAWGIIQAGAWNTWLPIGPFVGVPDVWPHIAAFLVAAGFRPMVGAEHEYEEEVYGGTLNAVPLPTNPPVPGLTLRRGVITGLWAAHEMRFTALLDGQELGWCEIALDLTEHGALPALPQWAWLTELRVEEPWRNRGIGTWLVQYAVAWSRLGGRSRLVVATMADNAGAIRFYRRFGWELLVHERKGWSRASSPVGGTAILSDAAIAETTGAVSDAGSEPPSP